MATELSQLEILRHDDYFQPTTSNCAPVAFARSADVLHTAAEAGTKARPPTNEAPNPSAGAPHAADNSRSSVDALRDLSNDQVTRRVARLNRRQQLINAELLLYLSELDARKLYRNHACSSMFDFLTTRLRQSEDVAYRWMWGARLLRAFPLVHELLVEGRLHLSALMLLKPHLTEDNQRDWLMAAAGKSKREVEKLVATRCPKHDVPTRVRKLPDSASRQGGDRSHSFTEQAHSPALEHAAARSPLSAAPSVAATSLMSPETSQPSTSAGTQPLSQEPIQPLPAAPPLHLPSRAPKIQPLSEHSYRVVFTANQRLKDKLQRAGELASHAVAPTDLPALLERALDLLIEREEKRRYGTPAGRRPSAPTTEGTVSSSVTMITHSKQPLTENTVRTSSQGSSAGTPLGQVTEARCKNERRTVGVTDVGSNGAMASAPRGATYTGLAMISGGVAPEVDDALEGHEKRSRRPPARVRREVWERDAGQCTYVDAEGRRCQSRHRLEFDHCVAHALGGEPNATNIRMRCHMHNALAAEQVFGVQRIAAAVDASREHRRRKARERCSQDSSPTMTR